METFSSFDSAHLSLPSQSDINNINRRQKTFIEKQTNFRSDGLNNPRSSLETNRISRQTDQNKSNMRSKRFASTELLDTSKIDESKKHDQRSMGDILIKQRQRAGKEIFCINRKDFS
jgi:hypothetical protein